MHGYFTNNGYVGYVNGIPMLFASESDYYDYMMEEQYDERAFSEASERAGWQ